MRVLLYIICCAVITVSAYWAYKENYETQASIRRLSDLHQQIADEREAISILNAEWAYLNRPERLRALVELNFDDLELLNLLPEHYTDVDLVAYPQPTLSLPPVQDTVTVQAVTNPDAGDQ